MKLYYHKTDGGAEYYSLDHIDGCDEGDVRSAIMRTDGGEIEIFANTLKEAILALFPSADIRLGFTRGLCSYYAEEGGVLVGFEGA